jgi:hypothetical protein
VQCYVTSSFQCSKDNVGFNSECMQRSSAPQIMDDTATHTFKNVLYLQIQFKVCETSCSFERIQELKTSVEWFKIVAPIQNEKSSSIFLGISSHLWGIEQSVFAIFSYLYFLHPFFKDKWLCMYVFPHISFHIHTVPKHLFATSPFRKKITKIQWN